MDLKTEIMRRVDKLPPELLAQLLSFAVGIGKPPAGEPGTNLLPFAGQLDATSAKEMTAAIETGCEGIDAREW